MKWINLVGLCAVFFLVKEVSAETRADLVLMGYVQPLIGIQLKEQRESGNQSLFFLSTQTNLEHPTEGQTFEVEGLDQKGLESHIDTITSKDHTIQYAILIKRLQSFMPTNKPILLKISAN